MSINESYDDEASRRSYAGPYSSRHPIPNVQRYLEHKDEIDQRQQEAVESQKDETDESKLKRAYNSVKSIVTGEDKEKLPGDPYPTANYNLQAAQAPPEKQQDQKGGIAPHSPAKQSNNSSDGQSQPYNGKTPNGNQKDGGKNKPSKSATQAVASHHDPRQKRKDMKHMKRDDGGREVTDPVTHLPIVIRDSTVKDLRRAPENEPAPGAQVRSSTGLSGGAKSRTDLEEETEELQTGYESMQKKFPPPKFEDAKAELARTYTFALMVGLGSILTLATLVLVVWQLLDIRKPQMQESGIWSTRNEEQRRMFIPISVTTILVTLAGGSLIWAIQGWLDGKVKEIWEDEVWDASREQERELLEQSDAHLPESAAWLNSLLASCWPLINPDLFASLSDMLEDVMQASLPKLVRMVSVEDLGQGSEAIRILGVRWLPTGAASQSVDEQGNLRSSKEDQDNDRNASGEGQIEDDNDDNNNNNKKRGSEAPHKNEAEKSEKSEEDVEESKKSEQQQKQDSQDKKAVREGMEAEQGDFVNMELAFAYRTRSSGKSMKEKAKNAHLYLKFYFPGGILFPVWVEVKGLIGTMRVRLQLSPDPPFFSLCTLTFLGQPRANLSCVPINQHLLNIMDLPLISSFVQTSIDAALAEYVAPKSLTLNLKDMIVGADFKKDVTARGVVMVYIKSARNFKEGDGGIGPIRGSSDAYVTVSWGKFGKPMACTRIIVDDQEPNWGEWAYVLCGPEEINADEKLRLQLWDSDRYTADDDLGRVEVDLKELMHSSRTRNKMCDREDRFSGEQGDEKMPGTLHWSVGFFAKAHIAPEQLAHQTHDKNIKTEEDLKRVASESTHKKLREATNKDESREIHHQELAEYKEKEDAMIISGPPNKERPSGILSIQIHNITGLELEKQNKRSTQDEVYREDEAEESNDLPSSYATIILNHATIYRTRTKPKNAKPFFNACTERFIRDWQITEVMLGVRDSREHENDALLGVVFLPLAKIFHSRSQVIDVYPLAGGIGYGKARISMVFKSVEVQLPKELLGWDYGTLEIRAPVTIKSQLPNGLDAYRLKLRTNISRIKMYSQNREWKPRHGDSGFLAVRKRYSTPLIVEWRSSNVLRDSTAAFAVMWLKDIPDEEQRTVSMQVWKGSKQALKKATTCCDYDGVEDDERPLGQIEVTMKFWRGFSGYHKRYARNSKEHDMAQVMEVLDVVNDEKEPDTGIDEDDSDDSDDDEISIDESNHNEQNGQDSSPHMPKATDDTDQRDLSTKEKLKKMINPLSGKDGPADNEDDKDDTKTNNDSSNGIISKVGNVLDSHNDDEDGSRGVLNQIRDYKDHHEQLHRRHRGIMQWKGARTADWMATKIRHGRDRLSGVFEHGEREPGVETEV